MSELEILRATEASLADPEVPYDYAQWTACSVGHLYAAAAGTRPIGVDAPSGAVWLGGDEYRSVLNRVLVAAGEGTEDDTQSAMGALSCAVSRQPDGDRREQTLEWVRDAIRAVEAEHERARLDVLERAPEPELVA